MLIVLVIVAVVAIAAVAGAMLLMNNSGSNDNNNNDNDNDNDNNTGDNDNSTDEFDLANGSYMEWKTATESGPLTFNATMRWEVSNVTSSGYDITVQFISDFYNYSVTQHANRTDSVGSGAVDDNYTQGTLIGTETLSTAFGNKQVEHWRLTETEGTTTTVTDYYVGKDTKMVYKWVVTETDSSDPDNNTTSTTLLTATNIASITNGDKN